MLRIRIVVLVAIASLVGTVVVSSLAPSDALAGGVVRKGRAGDIYSLHAKPIRDQPVRYTLPGGRGFVVTDVMVNDLEIGNDQFVSLTDTDGNVLGVFRGGHVGMESGIRVTGEALLVHATNAIEPAQVTVCGYTF